MDLVDMGKYKDKNNGDYWILTAIEILIRYAFAIPVDRKDTNNMTKAVTLLLKHACLRINLMLILNWFSLMIDWNFTMLVSKPFWRSME